MADQTSSAPDREGEVGCASWLDAFSRRLAGWSIGRNPIPDSLQRSLARRWQQLDSEVDRIEHELHARSRLRRCDPQGTNALGTIANNRLLHHPESREYAAKRTAEGLSRQEMLRRLKRHLGRRLYPLIAPTSPPSRART